MARKIAVIGMGYVGIPVAALFADVEGFKVVGVQRRSERSGWKIDWLNKGKNPIGGDEPGLSELIARVVKKGTLTVVEDFSTCKDAEAVLIDVQTPVDEKKMPVYQSLEEVSAAIGKHIRPKTLIVVESTVAPGTTDYVVKPLLERSSRMKAVKDF
jgi:UDP-N-acetyl-D-mannosaminuronic acid dehydrogenase